MFLRVDPKVEERFPGIGAFQVVVEEVRVEERNPEVERLKEETVKKVRGKYDLLSLREVRAIRAYRDFMWRLEIDPTKTRPRSLGSEVPLRASCSRRRQECPATPAGSLGSAPAPCSQVDGTHF